jgi:hypothetical protein
VNYASWGRVNILEDFFSVLLFLAWMLKDSSSLCMFVALLNTFYYQLIVAVQKLA